MLHFALLLECQFSGNVTTSSTSTSPYLALEFFVTILTLKKGKDTYENYRRQWSIVHARILNNHEVIKLASISFERKYKET